MKIVTSAFVGALFVTSFVALSAGCASETSGGDETDQGAEALASKGNCKYLPDGTVRCQDPVLDGGSKGEPTTAAAPANTIMKVPPPGGTIMKVTPPPTTSTGAGKPLQCKGAEDTKNGCLPGYRCCANPVYGEAPICVKGNVCPG